MDVRMSSSLDIKCNHSYHVYVRVTICLRSDPEPLLPSANQGIDLFCFFLLLECKVCVWPEHVWAGIFVNTSGAERALDARKLENGRVQDSARQKRLRQDDLWKFTGIYTNRPCPSLQVWHPTIRAVGDASPPMELEYFR